MSLTCSVCIEKFTTIADLLAICGARPVEKNEGFYEISKVSTELATQIRALTGLDVRGFDLVLNRSGVQHALEQHDLGKVASEIAQGQVPIEKEDFEILVGWLLAPDSVNTGRPRPGKTPLPCVEFRFSHTIGLVCAVLEYRPGRQRLVLVTLYKKRPKN